MSATLQLIRQRLNQWNWRKKTAYANTKDKLYDHREHRLTFKENGT